MTMGESLLPVGARYAEVYARFRWHIPTTFNIGVAVCARQANDPSPPAPLYEDDTGHVSTHTFAEFRARSNQLAHTLSRLGIRRGDRVGVILSQRPETAVVHLAAYKLGAIALPLSTLFGPEALDYRLRDAGAKVVVTDTESLDRVLGVRDRLPELRHVLCVARAAAEGILDYERRLPAAPDSFTPVITAADDPALLIYTSGTTGPPKGALHAHRVLLGHLPGIQMPHDFLPQAGDRFWTPADWAWAGGLLDCLLPSLMFGVPVVARRFDKFDPEEAFALMARMGVRNAFIPPTALRMLRSAPSPQGRHGVRLRSVGSGGEALGAETLEWGKSALGLSINEFYGQTECNLVVAACAVIGVSRPGAIGRAVPGHEVAVICADGARAAPGELGQIAVKRPDPVMFLGHWGRPDATREKFIGDWMTTGDQGRIDQDGYFHFVGRDDDVITSASYRIGPGEIEDCLIRHPAVALAAVIGKPDAVRTEIVKAFIVLKDGHAPSDALAADI